MRDHGKLEWFGGNQDALNMYRDKRDAGPEGIEQDYADWIGQAIRARRQP